MRTHITDFELLNLPQTKKVLLLYPRYVIHTGRDNKI